MVDERAQESLADRYIAVWAIAAAIVAAGLWWWRGFPSPDWVLLGVLLLVTIAAERAELYLPFERAGLTFTLIEAAVAASLLLAPPTHVALLVPVGILLAQGTRQGPSVRKNVFNASQSVAGVGIAAAAMSAFPAVGPLVGGRPALGALVGAILFSAINAGAMTGLLLRLVGPDAYASIRRQVPIALVAALGTAAVGIVGVALWFSDPGLLVLLLAPAAAIHVAARAQIRASMLLDQVRADHDRLTRIVDGANDGILLLDRSGVVRVWNPAMEAMTGLPASRVVGRDVERVLTDTVREGGVPVRGRWLVDEAHTGAPRRELSARLRRVDGAIHDVRESHSLVFDDRGRCTGDVVVVRDVSRERELERLRGDFVARVSHELRTPLTPIRGFATILLRKGEALDADARREALERIVERADHLGDLVEDLLLVTRLDRNELEEMVHARPVALGPVLEAAAGGARGRDPARTITIHEAPGTDDALADPDRVRQIVEVLLDNACQYSPADTPIEVELDQVGDDVRVRVVDHGPGVPRDQRETVFEQFHRLEDPLTMRTGGVGLGLFIGRRLAEAMHGSLVVEDPRTGRGAVFVLRLPAAEPVTAEGAGSLGA